ncbi:PepSY domain-containing protein [Hymenobacter persicinus]|nr:PepSY domain-containing protein [Hymenobacter persicinus]
METTTSRPSAPTLSPVRRVVQRNMYRWHRLLGLLTVVPVIVWTLSGLSHPLMSNWLRPVIAKESLPAEAASRPTIALKQVLAQHKLSGLRNVRLVRWRGQPAYQLLLGAPTAAPRYFSAVTGAALPLEADQQYAEQLARYFTQDSVAPLVRAERLTEFTQDYPFVNRLLPAWKITLDRPGVSTVYVETMPARLATFNNPTRATFLRVFSLLHTWSWLELIANNTVRVLVMLVLLSVIIASAVSGLVIYGLLWKRFRKPRTAQDQIGWLRRYHRAVGLAVALVTLTFAFSGAWHVQRKLHPDNRLAYQHAPAVSTAQLEVDLTQLSLRWETVQNVALAELNGQVYYQVFQLAPEDVTMGQKATGASTGQPVQVVRAAPVQYYSAATGRLTPEAGAQYARQLASSFLTQAGDAPAAIINTQLVDHFGEEYNFINKRLPVVQVDFATPTRTTLSVEPATGRLAARLDNADRYEGLSFGFLHKFHLSGGLGKNVRDLITMLSAAGVLAVSVLGLILFVKVRR